jgi:inner membrane protein
MPSPIVHAATGYAIARLFPLNHKSDHWSNSGLFFYGVCVALIPDLDFLPQILTGERYHHGFTHSITCAIGFAVLVWLLSYVLWHRLSKRLLLMTMMLYGSHVLFDFFTQGGEGIQLLWPFTTEYFKSSITVFPSTYHSQPLFQHPGHIRFIIFELSYAIILVGSVWLLHCKEPRRK